jgi:hypothetical protein
MPLGTLISNNFLRHYLQFKLFQLRVILCKRVMANDKKL